MTPLRCLLLFALLGAGDAPAPARVNVHDLGEKDLAPYVTHLKEHGLAPVPYLVRCFEKHDVVFLGESHWVHENVRLVADSVEPLYREAGVRRLATEFLRSRHRERIDAIVTAPEFDEAGAIALFRDGPWPIWGFREYVDVIEAVWKLDRSLPEGAEPMRVVPLDSDWSQHALWFEIEDRTARFRVRLDREKHMTRILDEQAVAPKLKTLVHIGAGHAVVCHGERVATVLHRKYGDRILQVQLHSNIPAGRVRSRLTRWIEELHAKAGGAPIGFDVRGTVLAPVYDPECIWARSLPDAGFGDLAQGYVVLAPLDRLHRVTWIDGFVTAESFPDARDICERCGWIEKGTCEDAEELNAALAKRFAGGLVESE